MKQQAYGSEREQRQVYAIEVAAGDELYEVLCSRSAANLVNDKRNSLSSTTLDYSLADYSTELSFEMSTEISI